MEPKACTQDAHLSDSPVTAGICHRNIPTITKPPKIAATCPQDNSFSCTAISPIKDADGIAAIGRCQHDQSEQRHPTATANPLSDEYVNAAIQQHGYDSPECVIARLHQWIGLHGGENGVTLLMYEAHKALVKLRAPVAGEAVAEVQIDPHSPPDDERAIIVPLEDFEAVDAETKLYAAPQASEAVRKPVMTVAEFCAEAGRLGLTADTLAAQLAERPEFADCRPHMEETQTAVASALLASPHTGMRVDYRGLLRQAREALGAGSALAEMLRQLQEHLLELGQRWYSGDTDVVDELLQLYCVESEARAALATRPDQQKAGVSDA